jgi:hypothetical protein
MYCFEEASLDGCRGGLIRFLEVSECGRGNCSVVSECGRGNCI